MKNINNKSSEETRNTKVYNDLCCIVKGCEGPAKTTLEVTDYTNNHLYRIILKDGKIRAFCKPELKLEYRNIEDRRVCPLTRKRVNEVIEGLGIN